MAVSKTESEMHYIVNYQNTSLEMRVESVLNFHSYSVITLPVILHLSL